MDLVLNLVVCCSCCGTWLTLSLCTGWWKLDLVVVVMHRSWHHSHAACVSIHRLPLGVRDAHQAAVEAVVPVLLTIVAIVHPILLALVHLVLDVGVLIVSALQVSVLHVVPGLLPPLVHGSPPGVHEEVPDSCWLQSELPSDGHLHLLRGSLSLLKVGCSSPVSSKINKNKIL